MKKHQLSITNYQIKFRNSKIVHSLKIENWKLKIPSEAGFTLVEVLVTIIVIGVIGYMLSDILVRSLDNGQKSQVLGNVKQNAQTALSSMSQTIRNANQVICNSGTVLGLQDKDGNYTRFIFNAPVFPTSNGYITQDFPTVANPANSVNLCTPPIVTLNETILTDRNTLTGVSINHGAFTTLFNDGSKDNVTIHFDVCTGIQVQNCDTPTTGNFQGQLLQAVPFETTVQLR